MMVFLFRKLFFKFFFLVKHGENVSKLYHEKFKTKLDKATEAEEMAFSHYLLLQENFRFM